MWVAYHNRHTAVHLCVTIGSKIPKDSWFRLSPANRFQWCDYTEYWV